MADPRRDPETGGRSLADILREAGVDSPTRGRRRRWDETGDTGVRQRGTEPRDSPPGDTGRVADRPAFGRRAADTGRTPPAVPPADPVKQRSRAADPQTAAIPGLRPSRKPGVPGAAAAGEEGPSTGPIPIVRADDDPPLLEDEDLGAREGVLAWVRFAGELVVALAAGVGIYFLFTVLWEQLPHVAVVLAPIAVTALVGGVGAWRHRFGGEPLGFRLIAVLVFAGTLLTIAPAAGLLAAT
ncbi:hypothetical protein [Blastococcus sp. SYSU D00820]